MTVAELITFLGTLDQDKHAVVFDHRTSNRDVTHTTEINCALTVADCVILCNEDPE